MKTKKRAKKKDIYTKLITFPWFLGMVFLMIGVGRVHATSHTSNGEDITIREWFKT
uniref:Transmembrane protein n=1 Tax=Medicago truncatula TaxID=3880 RepID=I3S1L5_MEDTR|nr:unknown [Medicago truncatula]